MNIKDACEPAGVDMDFASPEGKVIPVDDAIRLIRKASRYERTKAFEEAAEKAPELVKLMDNEGLFHGPYASGYKTADEASSVAVAVLDAALRALAKEPQL